MKPVLLLVDLQNDYLAAPGLEPARSVITERAAALLKGCRARSIPVIHVWTTVSRDDDRRMPHWKRDGRWICEAGTVGHAPPESLKPAKDEWVIEKTFFSAFPNLRLEARLGELGADTVIVAGVHLHACVRQTVLDAYARGFEVWIAEDATGSDDPVHAAITRRYLESRASCFASVPELLARTDSTGSQAPPLDSAAAVQRADAAFGSWSRTGFSAKAAFMERLAVLLEQRAPVLSEQMAREIGKPVRYGRTEVIRTGEMLRAIVRRLQAGSDHRERPDVTLRRMPHGVVAIITPWNNPIYISLGKIVPALLCGNTVVWKPAPVADSISRMLLDLMRSAGLPEGSVVLACGGRDVAKSLMNDPRVNAVTITGSSLAGYSAQEICARRRIPLQAELGGNNASIIWPDTDLATAARLVAAGAFELAGQRCTANRRVIVHEGCHERFVELLLEETRLLRWGDPLDEETRIGPLVSTAQRDRVARVVERAQAGCGAPMQPLGSTQSAPGFEGAWFPPTIVFCDDPRHEIVQEETFGPVLVVQPAGGLDHAITLCNGVRQGLAAAIFSSSKVVVDRFLHEARAGIVKVNQSTSDAGVDVPFGGWKASGIGPPEHGNFDRDFYTRPQTCYSGPGL